MNLSSLLLILPYTLFEGLSLVNPFLKAFTNLMQKSCYLPQSYIIKISEAFGKLKSAILASRISYQNVFHYMSNEQILVTKTHSN